MLDEGERLTGKEEGGGRRRGMRTRRRRINCGGRGDGIKALGELLLI